MLPSMFLERVHYLSKGCRVYENWKQNGKQSSDNTEKKQAV